MKLTAAICPQCNGEIHITEETHQCYCSHCGTKIILNDASYTVTHRTIDEARIKEAEVNQQVQLGQLEIEKEKAKQKKTSFLFTLIVWFLSLIILIYLSVTTVDNVNFSPFQLVLILDLVIGLIIIPKQLRK